MELSLISCMELARPKHHEHKRQLKLQSSLDLWSKPDKAEPFSFVLVGPVS